MLLFPLPARALLASLAIFLVIGTTAACALTTGGDGTWRYRMTVTVETPEGDKSGYVVWQVTADSNWAPLPEQAPMNFEVKGEAVVVDLGQRGVLFALLRGQTLGSDYSKYVLFKAIPSPAPSSRIAKPLGADVKFVGGTPLPPDQYPMFVRFRDLNDPKTVESLMTQKRCPDTSGYPVKYCITEDRFVEAFGEGVNLKSVTLTITDEPVTSGIVEKYLPWLTSIGKGNLGGGRFSGPNFYESLGAWDFKREDK